MPAKKTSSIRAKRESVKTTRRPRNPEGVTRVWGGEDAPQAGNGENGRRPRRERKRAPEESADIRRANALLLRVWEHVYSQRDKFGKLDRE